jgi:hypothetical protein
MEVEVLVLRVLALSVKEWMVSMMMVLMVWGWRAMEGLGLPCLRFVFWD